MSECWFWQVRVARLLLLVARLLLLVVAFGAALSGAAAGPIKTQALRENVCGACVRAELGFLASDELHGRGSGTRDEHLAALYAASLFESFGLEPMGDGGFIQRAPLPHPFPERLEKHLEDAGLDQNQRSDTWNTLALLRGTDVGAGALGGKVTGDVILLTAHIDHLGVGKAYDGDSIYNGADDDASGTTAVLELARALSGLRGAARPRRSILFVLFGSEELGGYGNRYFLEHPPVALTQIVANLEFEMIGRPDRATPGSLWLTGYERSDLGPELKKHGARLAADPHPAEKFFRRSDNYALATKGIVAQTVSSFGLHADYHRPSDDVAHIDFGFLTGAIESMINPVRWLAGTNWRPSWRPGGKPEPQGPGKSD